jgi:soluble lytic murein transglycosylase
VGADLASTREAVRTNKSGLIVSVGVATCLLALSCDGADRAASVPRGSGVVKRDDGTSAGLASGVVKRDDGTSLESSLPPDGSDDARAEGPLGWAEMVRRQRWTEAASQIDALPHAERTKPEVLYARAHVAMALNDPKLALSCLEGLEQGLPLLAGDIQRSRAEAEAVAGPFLDAAVYFAARSTPDAMLKAALAFESAGEAARARAQCDRLLSSDRRTRTEEAAARIVRTRLADAAGDRVTAAADARWVAIHAPDGPNAKESDAALARLSPDRPLTAEELMKRARAWADAGRTDDALHALDRVAGAPAPKVARLDELRERADILYKTRGRSLEAARVLDECAAAGGPHAVEDDFHAARALARADKDDDAINRMALIARHHPNTTWGDEAQYFVPYLHLLHGNWKLAAGGFDEYVEKYPNGVERREVLRNRAIAHLMNQSYAIARKLFEQVAAQETDPLASARALTMAALGAMRDGDQLHAVARWSDVARSQPLSWPALIARRRLAEAGAPIPAVIEAGPPVSGVEPFPVPLPPSVELLHRIGLDGDAESALEERENVVTSHAPVGRSLEALCAAYGKLGRAKRRFQITRQIPSAALAFAPSSSTRWAWDCAYPEPYPDEVFAGAGHAEGSVSLAYAVMRQESNFDPDAVSPAHAVGLMQLLPETAVAVAGASHLTYDESRLSVPEINIALGIRYLQDLRARFDDRLALVVAAYNGGDDAVARWLTRAPGMDLDVFVERIPFPETRAYVARVMGNFARYEYLKKGEAGVPTIALALGSH